MNDKLQIIITTAPVGVVKPSMSWHFLRVVDAAGITWHYHARSRNNRVFWMCMEHTCTLKSGTYIHSSKIRKYTNLIEKQKYMFYDPFQYIRNQPPNDDKVIYVKMGYKDAYGNKL